VLLVDYLVDDQVLGLLSDPLVFILCYIVDLSPKLELIQVTVQSPLLHCGHFKLLPLFSIPNPCDLKDSPTMKLGPCAITSDSPLKCPLHRSCVITHKTPYRVLTWW